MNLNKAIRTARDKALSLGPTLDQEIDCVRRDITAKLARGELGPEVGKIIRQDLVLPVGNRPVS